MRYIKKRENFIKTNHLSVNEAFENDIRWGGSLIGRLINSTLRKGQIHAKKLGISSIVKSVEAEILGLLEENLEQTSKNKVTVLKIKFLLMEIYNVVVSNDPLDIKLKKLLGNGKDGSGLVSMTINEIKKIDDKELPNKGELISKLTKFREDLLPQLTGGSPSPETASPNTNDNSNTNLNFEFYKKTRELFKSIIDLNNAIKNKRVEVKENVSNINSSEIHSTSAWKKIIIASKNANINDLAQKLQKILNDSKSGDKLEKKVVVDIGKQVLLNEITTGKPITFEQLIKEEYKIPSEYDSVPKSISLLARIILAFKDDLGLIDTFGEAKSPLRSFIKSYDESKSVYKKIKTQDDSKDSDTSNDVDGSVDGDIKSIWNKYFKDGEEKDWKVDDADTEAIRKDVYKQLNKDKQISDSSQYDRIVRIVNLFGKAYSKYATDYIPSGRPKGRISLKTFREYEYIGDGNPKEWEEDKNPGYGPWAVKTTFDVWEKGIMKILENPSYRKVLSNYSFTNSGEYQKPKAGINLFNFINDMINGKDFRKARKEILKKYFVGGDTDKIEQITPEQKKVKNDDMGEPNSCEFHEFREYKRTYPFNLNKCIGEIIKITYDDENNKTRHLIGFLMGTRGDYLVFKYHKYDNVNKFEESIVSKYLPKDRKLPDGLKLKDDEELYVGLILIKNVKNVSRDQKITFKESQIVGRDDYSKDIKEITLNKARFSSIGIVNNMGNLEPLVIKTIKDRPNNDIIDIKSIKEDDFK